MNILIIGAGRMGASIISSWVKNNKCKFLKISVVEKSIERIRYLKKISSKIETYSDIPNNWTGDILFLAIKPQDFKLLSKDIKNKNIVFKNVISIVAGLTSNKIKTMLQTTQDITRVMPNLAVKLNLGVSCIYHSKRNGQKNKKKINSLFSVLGSTIYIKEEKLLEAVTAISGSGPAYFFLFLLVFEDIAKDLGFSNKVSKDIVFATILGAVELAKKESNTKSLIKSVSSKGGTTEAALKVLEKSNAGLYTLMRKAIYAAKDRANEISKSI